MASGARLDQHFLHPCFILCEIAEVVHHIALMFGERVVARMLCEIVGYAKMLCPRGCHTLGKRNIWPSCRAAKLSFPLKFKELPTHELGEVHTECPIRRWAAPICDTPLVGLLISHGKSNPTRRERTRPTHAAPNLLHAFDVRRLYDV